ncbi:protein TIFY 10a-like [Apium graveolens]|uniref:protein TIFY 10a-like n=1 Tax=Apium graveolens TaxID=4045 RepID=UPI003D7B6095
MSRISPEKSSKFARTVNLLSHYVKEKGSLRDLNIGINGDVSVENDVKPMNLFPQYATMPDAIRITSSRELQKGQMTIIYAGQVLVFDDFSGVKAKELMQLASKSVAPSYVNTSKAVENNGNWKPFASNSGSAQSQNEMKQAVGLDLPIARRASLHRFLSKRKGRASARGPYQLHKPSAKELFDLNL